MTTDMPVTASVVPEQRSRIRLTRCQRKVLRKIKETINPHLFQHIRKRGSRCRRLTDGIYNPVMNCNDALIMRLISRGYISIDHLNRVTIL